MPQVIAAIACHNRRDVTLSCLASLRDQVLPPHYNLSTVLVDDGSSDGTAEAVRLQHPDVTVIPVDGSHYWAGAMALAERQALQDGADFILWLNDDVRLKSSAVASLLAVSMLGGGAIAVGALSDPETGLASYGGQRRTSAWHPLRLQPVLPHGNVQPCDTFQGNCVLVPVESCRRLMGIDPLFDGVQGMADTDYGLRARRLDIPLLLTPDFVGICAPNRALPPWRDGRLDFRARVKALFGPRGLPLRPWTHFIARHAGAIWPLLWTMAVLRGIWQSAWASPRTDGQIAVALIEGVAPIYRRPYYQGLSQRRGIAFHIYDGLERRDSTADQAVAPLPLPLSRGRNLYWPRLRGRIAWSSGVFAALRSGVDAVVVGQHVHDLSLWFLWLWRRMAGRPKILAMGHFRIDGHGPVAWLRRVFLHGVDGALCYTEAGREACLRHGLAVDRITVIANTLDTARLLRLADERRQRLDAIRQRFGIAEGEAVFVFVGRLHAVKRIDLAVVATQTVIERGYACRLVVIGDGPAREDVRGQRGVTWLGSLYENEDVADWFAVAQAMVMPDAVGLGAVHAIASGVPVVALATGRAHRPEFAYLRSGENALLASGTDDLAECMIRLINDPDLRRRLEAGCRRTASVLSMDAMVSSVCDGVVQVVQPREQEAAV
jgi:GT2 family glycosyltransferase